jgi:hypothetical protein
VTSFQLQVRRQEAESRAATRRLLRGTVGGRVARNIIDRFSTGLMELVDKESAGRSAGVFTKMTESIAATLDDPGLDASTIARAFTCRSGPCKRCYNRLDLSAAADGCPP